MRRHVKGLCPSLLALLVVCTIDTLAYATPRGFVSTPDGIFPSTCVSDVGNGSHVDSSGNVTYANGKHATLPPCPGGKHFTDAPDYSPPSSWIMASIAQSPVPTVHMTATFVVPQAPTSSDDQLVYFFPGIRPANGASVLQPVLQWGGGDPDWQIASWSCAAVSGGPCPHSSYVSVNAGDTIFGEILGSNCTANGQCSWTITTTDKTTGQSTTLTTDYDRRVYVLLFGGVLESYDIGSCDDYPANKKAAFTDINFFDAKGNRLSPPWYPQYYDNSYCNLSVHATDSTTELDFPDSPR